MGVSISSQIRIPCLFLLAMFYYNKDPETSGFWLEFSPVWVRLSFSMQVTSESACRLACEIENEFLCRSFLYKGAPTGTSYNCQLFHLDHKTLPDGPSTYLNADRPLIDNGERVGTYYENHCESEYFF